MGVNKEETVTTSFLESELGFNRLTHTHTHTHTTHTHTHTQHTHTHTCRYSRRQYKVSIPLKKNCCPTAYQRLKKRNCLPFLRRLYDHNFYVPFSV